MHSSTKYTKSIVGKSDEIMNTSSRVVSKEQLHGDEEADANTNANPGVNEDENVHEVNAADTDSEVDAEVKEHNSSDTLNREHGSGSVSSVNDDELESSGLNHELAKQLLTRNISGEEFHYKPSSSTPDRNDSGSGSGSRSIRSTPIEAVLKEMTRPTVLSPLSSSTATSVKSSPATYQRVIDHENVSTSPVFESDADIENNNNHHTNAPPAATHSIYASVLSPAQRAEMTPDEAIPEYVLDRVRSNLQSQRSNELQQFVNSNKRRSGSFHTPRVASISAQQQQRQAPHSADLPPIANLGRFSRHSRAKSDMMSSTNDEDQDTNAIPQMELPSSHHESARRSLGNKTSTSADPSNMASNEQPSVGSDAGEAAPSILSTITAHPMSQPSFEGNNLSSFNNLQLNDTDNATQVPITSTSGHRFVVEDLEPSPQPQPLPPHSHSDTHIQILADNTKPAPQIPMTSFDGENDDEDEFSAFATSTSTPTGSTLIHTEQPTQPEPQADDEWGDDFSFSHADNPAAQLTQEATADADVKNVDDGDWDARFPTSPQTISTSTGGEFSQTSNDVINNQPQPQGGVWSLDRQQRAEQLNKIVRDSFPLSRIEGNATSPSLSSIASTGTGTGAGACCEASQKYPTIWTSGYCGHCGKQRSADDPYMRRLDSWQRSYFHQQLMKQLGR